MRLTKLSRRLELSEQCNVSVQDRHRAPDHRNPHRSLECRLAVDPEATGQELAKPTRIVMRKMEGLMKRVLKMRKDENPMPTKHQFFQLVLATALGFLAKAFVEKSYLKLWSLKFA
jgi:hypothetical protein